jgi:hypothetical protein
MGDSTSDRTRETSPPPAREPVGERVAGVFFFALFADARDDALGVVDRALSPSLAMSGEW